MFNKLGEDINYVGLSFKKELIIFLLINVVMIVGIVLLIIFKVTIFVILIYGSCLPFVDYFFLSRYKGLVNKKKDDHNAEFVSLLSYFEIYISNHNNVYKSFERLLPYCSEWMKERIEKLLQEIDIDKSVTPYIQFAKSFTYLVIENVMVSIFQMVEQGENEENLKQFDYVFSSLSDTLMVSKVDNYKKNIESLNAFPLFGAGFITIALTLSIVSILGELVNVI
ncbi:MAG: hypothetical protein K5906_03820 [Bacilli bacterium]|nr:hypothetical protein [Bacilli bacterium]